MLAIYDRATRKKVALLDNASDIVEHEAMNSVNTLSFLLPAEDPKSRFCTPYQYVRYGEDSELYRIMDITVEAQPDGVKLRHVYCEHIVTTLIDTVIFGTAQADNNRTRDVLEWLLSMQKQRDWVLGDCDFDRRFSYSWSNEHILASMYSVPSQFDEDYIWTYNTHAYPYVINLKRFDRDRKPEMYIREGLNLLSAAQEIKGTIMCNRIYALGYGEGANQLTIRDVNNGVPYVENPLSIARYGVVERIIEDARFEVAENLKNYALRVLDAQRDPHETYTVRAADISKITGKEIDRAAAGKIVQWGNVKTFIVSVDRHLDREGQDVLEIANKPADTAGSIANLADRQRLSRVYAQGSTTPFSIAFADNADETHPLTVELYIPPDAVNVNKVVAAWRTESFRAYSTAASSGGGSTQTSSSGGGQTTGGGGGTQRSTESGGYTQQTQPTKTSGSSSKSTSDAGGGRTSTFTTSGVYSTYSGYYAATSTVEGHSHQARDHVHRVSMVLDNHTHGMSHTHSIEGFTITVPNHSHGFTVPDHTHSTQAHTHSVTIPQHAHGIVYGIYTGTSASTLSLSVNGGTRVPVEVNTTEMDITNMLAKDDAGKIVRGFQRIAFYPDRQTRIAGTIYAQIFIQTLSGGTY